MRQWNTRDDLLFLQQVVNQLQDKKVLDPASLHLPAPLDLRGLLFPTVTEHQVLGLPKGTSRVVGQQSFSDANVGDVDFSQARLDFSIWENCSFERVCFDRTRLQNVRFFGCRFVECTFRSADLRNASFSIGRHGSETEVTSTLFEKADLRGASCSNPVFRSTTFENCRLDGFVFESAVLDQVVFTGEYEELTFRGLAGDVNRNRLMIDLSNAKVMWLHADYGIDLRPVVLPDDGSCLMISDRIRAVPYIAASLGEDQRTESRLVAKMLIGLYSDESMCPLKQDQETLLLSKAMIADFAETTDMGVVDALFGLIRDLARKGGFLVA